MTSEALQSLPYSLLAAFIGVVLMYTVHRRRLQKARQEYAQLLAATQAELQQVQKAQQSTKDAADVQSRFLTLMGHEIRTPLNAIIGLAQLIQNTELTPRQLDHVRKIERSSGQLQSVINDILDFSKMGSGVLQIEAIAFELDAMLQEVVKAVAPMAYEKGLEFICVTEANVPKHLLGDPLRLTQVLKNLLGYAIKQTALGEVVLQVQSFAAAPDRDGRPNVGLRFTVQDSSQGLSPQQCEHLFEGCLQPNFSQQPVIGARGPGLPVSKRLAELMGGEVGVSSVSGLGNALWFTAVVQPDPNPVLVRPAGEGVLGLRALVVDDNPIAAEALADLLKRLGLRADVCHCGRDGLEAVRQAERAPDPYAFVLLDWEMPDWDGLRSAQSIAAAGLAHSPHIVIVTGHSKDEIAKPANAAGLNEILIKPVTASTLFETLLRLAHARGAQKSHDPHLPPINVASLNDLRGAKVLLVEDDEISQEVACEMLRVAGMEVDIACDGQVALEQLARKHYDLVLMDMQMPVMDGLTATRHIRANPRHRDLPILAMTASATQADQYGGPLEGINGFVPKPIAPGQLESVLLRWIRPQPMSADAYK